MSLSHQIRNYRDRVHKAVGFTSNGRHHELVDHRYEKYISQMLIIFFTFMKTFWLWEKRRMSYKKHNLLSFHEYLRSSPFSRFWWVSCFSSFQFFVLCLLFCLYSFGVVSLMLPISCLQRCICLAPMLPLACTKYCSCLWVVHSRFSLSVFSSVYLHVMLWVRFPFIGKCILYNCVWYCLSMNRRRLVNFSGLFHQ